MLANPIGQAERRSRQSLGGHFRGSDAIAWRMRGPVRELVHIDEAGIKVWRA